jgi:hypothetical protein
MVTDSAIGVENALPEGKNPLSEYSLEAGLVVLDDFS